MSGSGDLDFIGQVLRQAPLVLFAPFVFGALYIGAMVIVFRRAADRRRKARAARGELPRPEPSEARRSTTLESLTAGVNAIRSTASATLAKQRLEHREQAQAALPEPDIDLLTMLVADAPDTPEKPVPATAPAALPPVERIERTAPLPEPESVLIEPMSEDAMPANDDLVEVMRVWRDVSDGSLILQIGSARYRTSDPITNPDQRRRLTAVLRELSAMVNLEAPAEPRPATPSAPVQPRIQPLPANPGEIGSFRARAVPNELETPKPNLIQRMVGARTAKDVEADAASGLASAVEEFLQYKLSMMPGFATRSIHIRPAHDHSLRIEVDGSFYNTIGDVVDVDVREFLFSVMKEWEARQ